MHEISLVKIFNTLRRSSRKMDEIRGIYLTVGELSNIQPLLMKTLDAVLQDEPKFCKTILHVDVLPIKVYCEHCDYRK